MCVFEYISTHHSKFTSGDFNVPMLKFCTFATIYVLIEDHLTHQSLQRKKQLKNLKTCSQFCQTAKTQMVLIGSNKTIPQMKIGEVLQSKGNMNSKSGGILTNWSGPKSKLGDFCNASHYLRIGESMLINSI